MTALSSFIRANTEPILAEWETFARGLAHGDDMDVASLRDHAKEMLGVIADDLARAQSAQQQADKALGQSDAGRRRSPTPAQRHGTGRAESGFTVEEMVAEFRALRASVISLWSRTQERVAATDLQDMIRFNEAIDQAIAESITTYTGEVRQTRDRFLGILGHDLRTPIGAIVTSTRFMLDTGDLREPHLALVSRMEQAARRMNRMVGDLLEFTRTRFGDAIPVSAAPMDAGNMIGDVSSEIRASYPSAIVNVQMSGDLRGRWDCERLTQAMINLVNNAIEHGASAPIDIVAVGGADGLSISVRNQGPVIPDSEMPGLFAAMKNVDTSPGRDRRHLGLGLFIVDRIVRGHGGTVSVRSSEKDGTTFTVWLPRAA